MYPVTCGRRPRRYHSHKEHQEAFVEDRLLRILRGDVAGVITGMRRMASQRNLKGEALKTVTTACNYFENNAQRMRYDKYLQAGYPIASWRDRGRLSARHQRSDGARRHALDAGGS